jgi:hypothetical protein
LRLRERDHALLNRNPDLSRGHGDTEKAETILYRVFSASLRLRENIRVFPDETPVLSQRRGGAEECIAIRFSGSPCLRGPVRASVFFQNINPDLSPRREGAKKHIEWGFLRVLASLREKSCPPESKPDLSRGHGGTEKAETILYRVFSAPPRLCENIRVFPDETLFSRRDAEARRNA